MTIGNKKIGHDFPTFVVAEMSGNHNQDINRAYQIIDAAAEAGADAIKLQTYTADTITIDSDEAPFRLGADVNEAWAGQTLYKLYQQAFTPWGWQPKLKEYAEKKGLICFSTPFDETSVDFLENLNVPAYKVASFELVDIPLLKKIGQTKKPVIISRGMASLEEIELAVETLKKAGTSGVAVLHCVSAYPARPDQMNLATIPDLAKRFDVIPGLSDHTLGITVPIAAVTLGAKIIEKHFTLARADGGPDASFSLEPKELKELVDAIRDIEKAVGKPTYGASGGESEYLKYRRSLFAVADIKKGEAFTKDNIRSIRPGFGLPPKYFEQIIGKKAKQDIKRGTPLGWEMIK